MAVPRPSEIPRIFERFRGYGIVGVAYGSKVTGGEVRRDTPSIAFLVERKVDALKSAPTWGDLKALPGELTLDAGTVPTDVVPITTDPSPATGIRTNKPQAVPGDEISYQGHSGSMACLVRDATGQVAALTNNHVAPDLGRKVKFRHSGHGLITMPVTKTIEHLPDDQFMPFVDDPNDQLRIDASLIALNAPQLPSFSNTVPHFGTIGAPFVPDYASLEAYRRSLDQLRVYAYSFNTKRRFGTVTHVYGVLNDPVGGTLAKACMLIQGLDGIAPSAPLDSGKLWMTKVDGVNRPVGLHFGRQEFNGTLLASACDFGALCKLWQLSIF